MAFESAKNFLLKMQQDAGFAQQVVEASSRDERRSLIASQGFDFSLADLEKAVAEITDSEDSELSISDLTGVSGGASLGGSFGNTFFKFAVKDFQKGLTSKGSSFKCDSSGSEGECVC